MEGADPAKLVPTSWLAETVGRAVISQEHSHVHVAKQAAPAPAG